MSKETGTIKVVIRDYGFILPDKGGKDIFLHHTGMKNGAEIPEVGRRISYETAPSPKGPKAINAEAIDGNGNRAIKFGDELGAG